MDGQDLRARRARYGLTQAAVARAAGMRQPDLSAIENGRRGSSHLSARVEAAIRALVTPRTIIEDDALRQQVRAILAAHGATDVRVFGSVARAEDRPGSDLDLMASFAPGFDLFDLMEVEEELEAVLGIAVDVVATDDRSPSALAEARAAAIPL